MEFEEPESEHQARNGDLRDPQRANRPAEEQAESGEQRERTSRIRLQSCEEMAVHGRLDAGRHPAEGTRHAG